jgi:hypothetical protein
MGRKMHRGAIKEEQRLLAELPSELAAKIKETELAQKK